MQEDKNLLDYVYVLVKWRRLIIYPVFFVVLAAAGVAMLLPERWQADTTLLPSEEEAGSFEISMLLGSTMPGGLGGLLGQATPGERLLTVLKSRRVLGVMVDRFELIHDYGAPNREQAIETLREEVEAELSRDGALRIQVEASTPSLAANLANGLAAELDAVVRDNKRVQASDLSIFLLERMETVQQEIEVKGIDLQRFQEDSGVVDLEAQTAAMVDLTQQIVQELALLEVKLGIAQRRLHPEHEERRMLEIEAEELRKQLARAVGEPGPRSKPKANDTFSALGPSLRQWPSLGLEYAQLTLELKVAEQVLIFLAAQLEDAKYRQAQDAPLLHVLDPAVEPEFRSAPSRTLIVLIAAGLSLVCGVVLAFFFESLGRLSENNREKLVAIRGQWGKKS
ncbi:MAG: tyrosine-protein kinase Etk/Wzc [Candidatus Latescibacterota bacterium]|jgi:tyrosine-protein kinase Etk/Wzc